MNCHVSEDVVINVSCLGLQRDYQHHATVFKSPYAKNPFDNISAEELQEYKRIIDSKNRKDGKFLSLILHLVVRASDTGS